MPPQPWGCRKSTGEATPALEGKRRRKSSSTGFTSFLMARTWQGESAASQPPWHTRPRREGLRKELLSIAAPQK